LVPSTRRLGDAAASDGYERKKKGRAAAGSPFSFAVPPKVAGGGGASALATTSAHLRGAALELALRVRVFVNTGDYAREAGARQILP
jgi:hypothetical protein